jgi:hypothetical protein
LGRDLISECPGEQVPCRGVSRFQGDSVLKLLDGAMIVELIPINISKGDMGLRKLRIDSKGLPGKLVGSLQVFGIA